MFSCSKMEKKTVSHWLSGLGAALLGTAALIALTNPTNITIAMTPFVGNRVTIISILALCGVKSAALGLLVGKK